MISAPMAIRTDLAGLPSRKLESRAAYYASRTAHGISWDIRTHLFSGFSLMPPNSVASSKKVAWCAFLSYMIFSLLIRCKGFGGFKGFPLHRLYQESGEKRCGCWGFSLFRRTLNYVVFCSLIHFNYILGGNVRLNVVNGSKNIPGRP